MCWVAKSLSLNLVNSLDFGAYSKLEERPVWFQSWNLIKKLALTVKLEHGRLEYEVCKNQYLLILSANFFLLSNTKKTSEIVSNTEKLYFCAALLFIWVNK